ncbi:MAG TPA: head GIN domain-containing protein [Chitinophagaceae bacterium]|nr:head GIN domain-containing protein [Chitinophagaceae bacterium]
MKKILSVVLFAVLVTATQAQKTINDANAEKRTASGYHAIEVSGGIDLYLSSGNESVAVSASETKYRDNIITEVKDGVLKIWYDQKKNGLNAEWGNRKLKAYVSYKTLDKLNGSGGSDISVEGTINAGTFKLDISGGSDFDGRIEATDLSINASGGSDLNIGGSAKTLDLDLSGGSDLDGYGLVTDICNLEASGGSDANITVNKELKAVASGSSDVSYKGNGTIKEMRSSGSSSIKKAGR